MCNKLSLCLFLHLCYTAAFPVSPPLALTPGPFQLPDLGDRADTQFVTIYGLYDNSLHTPTLDNSKPKLAPITEAFMAMTRALATATVTASGSGSVSPSATPTPLHKMTPPSLVPGLVVRPTPVQSSIASTSSNVPQDTLDDLQRSARLRNHHLVVLGSVVAGVAFISLLLFFLLDPRMMRKLCGKTVHNKLRLPSKRFFGRPVPTWDVSPISSSDYAFVDDINEKPFFAQRKPGDVVIEVLPKHPISKFSICSSEYPPSVSEYEIGPNTHKSETCPVRPPRPPTADSPALSESVYLACADQPYIIVAPQPFADIGQKLLSPREFLNMYGAHPESTSDHAQSNTTPEYYDTRHSRTHSAPLFVGSMNCEINDLPEPIAIQRMLKHRRSRSASGWAYPSRPPSKRQHNQLPFSSRQ